MEALPFITEMLNLPTFRDLLSEKLRDVFKDGPNVSYNIPGILDMLTKEIITVDRLMRRTNFNAFPGHKKRALIESVRLAAHKIGNCVNEILKNAPGKQPSSSGTHDFVKDLSEIPDLLVGIMAARDDLKETETLKLNEELDMFQICLRNAKKKLEKADSSNGITLDMGESQALLLIKAFPALDELEESGVQKAHYLEEVHMDLQNIPLLICKACEGKSLAIILIGCLLLFKERNYDTWSRVKDDLFKIKESNDRVTSNPMWHIFTYCYDDLPYPLKLCFLYFACYPIDYEIPATSLIEIWIAEGFVTPEQGETTEETANKYLEQLIQRSLVSVSERSFLGTIKICRVPRSIHEFVIQQSDMDRFLVANPDQEKIASLFRLAIHHDNKKQYVEVKNNNILSFLAFNLDRNVLGSAVLLRVLELRKSTIPVIALSNMTYLRYLNLRGSNISNLPQNMGDMKNLQTLDVRDTSIETVPDSLWNISTLSHVYVKPSPKIKGPPSMAKISDLHILKTVVAHESWEENIPKFLINLRKLALSNRDNLHWKTISNLVSHMDKLISMAIMSNIIPSESIDTRAFPNLETVKSVKLEGKWNCRNLFIDNVKFPPNLTKLTLTNSGLKEDPMLKLERLQALKFLSLQDGAYTGNKMVCLTEGFPKLQFLKLKKLENLENWEVKLGAMPQLTTLHVNQCRKHIGNNPNLDHVTDKVID